MGKTNPQELRQNSKLVEKIMLELRGSWVFVEGRKDKAAMARLGITKVKTISGNLRQSCESLGDDAGKVIVLTDLDRRGDQLALAARDELEGCSRQADIETRRRLGGVLALRYFESLDRKYEEFQEKVSGKEKSKKK